MALTKLNEKEFSFWKRVICTKYSVPLNAIRWNWNGGHSCSFFIKAVKVLEEELQVIVGRGDRVRTWDDINFEGVSVKDAFPRIFFSCFQ